MDLDLLNASLLILKPKQPFLDWINAIDHDMVLTMKDVVDEECGLETYLIPDFEDLPKAQCWLKKHFKGLFEEKLVGWSQDENDWPEDLTYKLFTQWFDIEFNLMVFDYRTPKRSEK